MYKGLEIWWNHITYKNMEDLTYYLSNIMNSPKSSDLQFFAVIEPELIAKNVVAMANEKGGNIIIGITEDHQVLGLSDDEQQYEDLHTIVNSRIAPKVSCNFYRTQFDSKQILLITILEGSSKPYLLDTSAYVYVADQAIKADNRLIGLLFDERAQHDLSWEREKVYTATLDDLDYDCINSVKLVASQRHPIYNDYSEEHFLQELGLLHLGVPTNACVLLFAKHPAQFIPQSRIRLSVYDGKTGNASLAQVRVYDGNLFNNLHAITTELNTLYGTKIQIEGTYRKEIPMLPAVIFRESILNAMVHRDYSSHSSFLNICVSSTDLKIISYGGLLDGITVPLLAQEHNSILRNPDIANVCYLYNLIEVAGSGTLRILSESRLYPGLEPQWQDQDNIVTLTLNGITYAPVAGLNRHRIQVSNETMQQVLDLILAYIEKNPGCKLQQIQELVGKSIASTKRYIQFLKDNGVIQYVGSLKSGGYKLID